MSGAVVAACHIFLMIYHPILEIKLCQKQQILSLIAYFGRTKMK